MNTKQILNQKISAAMQSAGIAADQSPLIAKSKHPKGGDFQANGVLPAAKSLGTSPRELALKVLNELKLDDIAEKVEVSGPGFINIHLSDQWLAQVLNSIIDDEKLGIKPTQQPQTIVVDYSAPNLAKEMHVGHLRSTIIGYAHVRLLEFLGHKVIRQNHIGDWGTQFGMLIAELEQVLYQDPVLQKDQDTHKKEFFQKEQAEHVELKDLEIFYQQSKKHFDQSKEFASKARDYVVKLQSGDPKALKLWKQFIELSLSHSDEIYKKLKVSLTRDDVMGESAYNEDLPILVEELKQQKLATEDQGATVVFLDEHADKNGDSTPVIIKKQGGGYLYSTTDLAAIRYRAKTLKADSILYFIDARQSLHLSQIFTLARKAQFAPQHLVLKHCAFGTMMGKDGKPFKTRSGGVIKLETLLDEAVGKAKGLLDQKETDLSEQEILEIAQKVGIGAIKYADLSKTRTNDYIFDWETMLNLNGNTATLLTICLYQN